MRYYNYHKKSDTVIEEARQDYPNLFDHWLSEESIEARYHLLQYLKNTYAYDSPLEKDMDGRPVPISIDGKEGLLYWSISHSEDYIAYIVGPTRVGIDIAWFRERGESLLNTHSAKEYALLGGINWEHFYRLWTAKEAIIKSTGWILDEMKDISLFEKIDTNITCFVFRWETIPIQTTIGEDFILSFTL